MIRLCAGCHIVWIMMHFNIYSIAQKSKDIQCKNYFLRNKNLSYQVLDCLSVPVNSFLNGIFSLLTSTELMTSNKLLFADCTNPCYVPEKDPNGNYGGINNGNSYYQFHSTIDKDKKSHT